MLKIEGLTKTFGTLAAVNNVSFEVPAGQMLGVIGRSGAGKSTLLRLINRLAEPTAGKVFYESRDVTIAERARASTVAATLRDDFSAVQLGASS